MNLEVMEKKLYDACLKGDVEMLKALMREDELILARISLSSFFNQTPLHLACMLGHFEFAKSLISYKPDFVSRLDTQGRSPLHLASANGYANIVKMLLKHDWKMCRICDEEGRTPLHLAVMNGEHESVMELIKVNSESYSHELGTALHLCVMYNRLNVLIPILESNDQDLPNFKDDKGNTILHSAIALKRMQIIKYLLKTTSHVLDAANENGLTALDMIEQMPKDAKTMEIKELLVSPGTLKATDQKTDSWWRKRWNWFKGHTIFQEKQEKRDESLLVAASVIAAMAYSAAISPPGGVASMDAREHSKDKHAADIPSEVYHLNPAASLLAYFNPKLSYTFWISNHISFMASLSVIFLYVSGATLQRRYFTWLIRGAMWITLTSMTIAYVCAVSATTGSSQYYHTLYPLIFGLLAWGILILVSFVVLIYRLQRCIVPMFTKKKNTSHEDSSASKSTNTNIVSISVSDDQRGNLYN